MVDAHAMADHVEHVIGGELGWGLGPGGEKLRIGTSLALDVTRSPSPTGASVGQESGATFIQDMFEQLIGA